jgi:putative ABC transport system permease protein
LVRQHLSGYREIESFSFVSSNMPFSFSTMNNGLEHKGKNVMTDVVNTGFEYPSVMGMTLQSGRWFTPADTVGGVRPVVLTRHLAEALFGTEDPVGKIVGTEDPVGNIEGAEENRRKVVGVVPYYRHKSSFQADENCMFEPAATWDNHLMLKMTPQANAETEADVANSIQQLGKDWVLEIKHLDDMRATQDKTILIPILILFVVCGFLVFNVALGLFGVLFQNLSRRKGEIGIRRALGASQIGILQYFIGETLVIATFGVLLGVFFAVQVPLLKVFDVESSVYFLGMLMAAISIYLITALCAWYPSRQAAAIYPAVALHED